MNKLLIALIAATLAGPIMAADEPETGAAKTESAEKPVAEAVTAASEGEKSAEAASAPKPPKTAEAVAE